MDKLQTTFTQKLSGIRWFWVVTFIALSAFFWLTPLQVDDYTFYTTFSSIHNLADFLHINHYLFNNVNGRVAGNALALSLVSNRILSSLFRAAVVVTILLLSCQLLKIRSKVGRNVLVTLLLFVPVPIFAETYAWRAGFFNYVTPVALVLLITYILMKPADRKYRSAGARLLQIATLFASGFLVSLFTENITVGIFAGSLLVTVWCLITNRALIAGALSLLAGSLLGSWLMFSSPVYTKVSSGSDAYRHVGHSAMGTLQVILHNTVNVSKYLIVGNFWLYLTIFSIILSIVLISRDNTKVRKWYSTALACAVALVTFLFIVLPYAVSNDKYLTVTQSLSSVIEIVAVGLFFITCLVFSALYIKDRERRNKSLILITLTGLVSAPLLLVQPVSPRIFYISYVLLVLYTFILVREWTSHFITVNSLNRRVVLFVSYTLLVGGAVFYLSVFGAIRLREVNNAVSARNQISQGHTTVHIKRYPFSNFTYKDKYLTSWPSRYFSGSVCKYRQCDQQRIKVIFN